MTMLLGSDDHLPAKDTDSPQPDDVPPAKLSMRDYAKSLLSPKRIAQGSGALLRSFKTYMAQMLAPQTLRQRLFDIYNSPITRGNLGSAFLAIDAARPLFAGLTIAYAVGCMCLTAHESLMGEEHKKHARVSLQFACQAVVNVVLGIGIMLKAHPHLKDMPVHQIFSDPAIDIACGFAVGGAGHLMKGTAQNMHGPRKGMVGKIGTSLYGVSDIVIVGSLFALSDIEKLLAAAAFVCGVTKSILDQAPKPPQVRTPDHLIVKHLTGDKLCSAGWLIASAGVAATAIEAIIRHAQPHNLFTIAAFALVASAYLPYDRELNKSFVPDVRNIVCRPGKKPPGLEQ